MARLIPHRRRVALLATLLAIAAIWWSGLRPDPAARPSGLDADAWRVVRAGDEAAAAALVAHRGSWSAVGTYEALRDAHAREDDPAGRDSLAAALATWAGGLARGLELPEYRRDAAFRRARTPAEAARLLQRRQAVAAALADTVAPADSVRARLLAQASALRRAGDHLEAARTAYHAANLGLKVGDHAAAREEFAAVLADARAHGLTASTCDALNSLALFAVMERDTAGAAWLRESVDLARRSRLAARAGRALTVAGIQAHREGRFARALDLLEEAVTLCRELGEAWQGLPYLVYLMRVHAGLDDWDQVASLAPRAELLLREAAAAGADPLLQQREGLRLQELQLRLAIRGGQVAAALEAYPRLVAAARRQPFAELAYVQDRQLRALLAAGRPDAVLARLPAALAHAQGGNHPEQLNLALVAVEAHLDRDDLAAASRALARYDTMAVAHPRWVVELGRDADALRAVLHVRRGDRHAAGSALRAGLESLAGRLRHSDASSLAYLELQRDRRLRRALRAVLGEDLPTAYGAELLWRRLPAWLGEPGPPAALAEDPVGLARELAAERRARLGPRRRHLMVVRAGRRLVRWQADAHGLRVDTLAVGPGALAAQVASLLEPLTCDPGPEAAIPPSLTAAAEALALALLPADLSGPPDAAPAARSADVLLVSAEGDLAQLPFAVLDTDPGPHYRPLAHVVDVAVLRDAGPWPGVPAAHPGLVVADPVLPDRLRRRHPALANLVATAAEADRVQALIPGMGRLEGPAATLPALRSRWQRADVLYFACHTLRGPESPFRTFVPLGAVGGAAALQTPYLDVAAIRGADHGATRLVVLASCASGAPYVSGRAWAPSLSDAFLDGGARAVLTTLWRVRDDQAASLPLAFLRAWRDGGRDPVAAIGEARRRLGRTPDGEVAHPFGWAAWMLALRDL